LQVAAVVGIFNDWELYVSFGILVKRLDFCSLCSFPVCERVSVENFYLPGAEVFENFYIRDILS